MEPPEQVHPMPSKNVIPDRIAASLRRFPPFSMLPAEAVQDLAGEAFVRALAAGDYVWRQGDRPGDEVLFLAHGRVEYIWQVEERPERVDIRDVGDVLGFTAIMRNEAHHNVSAQAVEDCLFYGLPGRKVRDLLEMHDEARNYVRRHLFWVTRVGISVPLDEPTGSAIAGRANALGAVMDANTRHPVISCPPYSDRFGGGDIYSSLRLPSGIATPTIMEPDGAALLAAKILAMSDRELDARLSAYRQRFAADLLKADEEVRKL